MHINVYINIHMNSNTDINMINDSHVNIIARHDGYKNFNIIHQREWTFDNNQIIINEVSKSSSATTLRCIEPILYVGYS